MNPTVNFYCYQPAPEWKSLPEFEQLVYGVLRDARGYFRSSGMTIPNIWRQLAAGAFRLTAQRRERVEIALERLADVGVVVKVGADRWRAA